MAFSLLNEAGVKGKSHGFDIIWHPTIYTKILGELFY